MSKDKVSLERVSRFVSLEICLKDIEHAIDEQTNTLEGIESIITESEEKPYMEVLESIDESLKYIVNRAKGNEG